MRFRPCIDLHNGKVTQIVGSSLQDSGEAVTNFVSEQPPAYYAELYYKDNLPGGHVIMLGPNNETAAQEALACHPGHLQVGGGINPSNAASWIEAGAGKVIVTSYLITDGEVDLVKVKAMADAVSRERLVIDLSCLPVDGEYHVTCNRWQTICAMVLSPETLETLSEYCSEYLVHAVQLEGKQGGIDRQLVELLGKWSPVPVTYAGGIRSMADIQAIGESGNWKVDFTVGSA
ncbi:MAG: phosphoribosylformimino-5-aminoimidazole carboxamide ribotide isomerase, partial [Victivallales bacterium]|nr:phosphoribosylformimino-5-aminoimidazole carboxamide ribotide isomerase [Victivallales bacterium]